MRIAPLIISAAFALSGDYLILEHEPPYLKMKYHYSKAPLNLTIKVMRSDNQSQFYFTGMSSKSNSGYNEQSVSVYACLLLRI
jgi:hypothetical protein